MDDDLGELQALHKADSSLFTALDEDGDNAAGTARHVLLRDLIVLVGLETGIIDLFDLVVILEELCDSERVGTMTFHSQRQRIQAEV